MANGFPINPAPIRPNPVPIRPTVGMPPSPGTQQRPASPGDNAFSHGGIPAPIVIPQQVTGSYQYKSPTVKTKNAPANPRGNSNPYGNVPIYNPKPQTPAQIVAQLNKLVSSLGAGGPHVPAALSLARIAQMVQALPTHPNIPGQFSLSSVANALTPGKNTPGYVDPAAAANAAAEQQYGGAITQDRTNVAQAEAQNTQNLQDIQNWYNSMTGMAKSNAASDAAGYDAAIQGTSNLGSVSTALGMDHGSDGANTIDQTGSILNAAARMAGASGRQFDNNMIGTMGLSGVQDYQNQKNKDAVSLANLQNTLGSDLKGRGAAYTSALDAAKQANTGNAQNYSTALGNINQAYNNNFQNTLSDKGKKISTLTGLNNQYVTQSQNNTRTKLAGLSTAAAVMAIPGQQQATAAKANYMNANAYKSFATGQADVLKAQAAKLTAAGKNATGLFKNRQAQFQLGGQILKTVSADPKAFVHDPITGAVTLKDPKQARTDIAAMLMQAGYDPTKGAGALLNNTALAMILGYQKG